MSKRAGAHLRVGPRAHAPAARLYAEEGRVADRFFLKKGPRGGAAEARHRVVVACVRGGDLYAEEGKRRGRLDSRFEKG